MSGGDHEPATAGPLSGVAVYTMFRGDPAQLLQWCNFHLNAGAEQLYVALDCPPDGLVASLPEHPRIHWLVMDQPTWDRYYPAGGQNVERKQVDCFRWTARRAADEGHRFLAFIDADELISLSEPFLDVAARSPEAPAFTLPVSEMWFDGHDTTAEPFSATLALRKSSPRRVVWRRALGWRAQFLRNGVMGHDAGKSVYRLPMAAGDISVHRYLTKPVLARSVVLPAASGGLLHFDCGSLVIWNAKWSSRLAGGTVATGLGPQRRAQQSLFAHALRRPAAEQEAFFRGFFSLDQEAQALLDAEGLLRHVDVSDSLSTPLPLPASSPSGDADLVQLPEQGERVAFQFALVCDRRFVKPTFATMASVLSHMGDKGSVRFVVLGDGLEGEDVAHLRRLERTAYDVEVVVHDITADLDRDVGTEDTKRATFGRIYLIDYLPPQRTVYLDGDVLATREFSELFDMDLGGACLAGVPDSAALRIVANPARVPIQQRNRLIGITDGDPLEYLNGGVLIFDLDNPDFRGLALEARALVVTYGRALRQRDQDATNLAFSGRKLRLDSTYNHMTQFYVSDRCLDGELVRRKYDAADASLIHFSGKIKPWESPDDEFYNGLYRRMVAEAEERVGLSCEFYFSTLRHTRLDWSAERWAEVLGTHPEPQTVEEPVAELELLDVCDDGVYVALSPEMQEFLRTRTLSLAAYAGGRTLFEVPLARLTPQQTHIAERVQPGVRKLPVDLTRALAPSNGVARNVELALTDPAADGGSGFVRVVGSVDLVAAGAAATSDRLQDLGVDGVVEDFRGGWLSGWFRARVEGTDEAVSLFIDEELAARRPANLRRPDLDTDNGVFGFNFNVGRLLELGYGTGAEVSVRVSGTNIPLRGAPLPLPESGRPLGYEADRDEWVVRRREWKPVVRRVGGRLKRVSTQVADRPVRSIRERNRATPD